MEENKNIGNKPVKEKMDWRPIISFYAKTTAWIFFPLFFGAIGGGYVSKSIGSQVIFFIFVVFGFVITCFGIYREIKQYKKGLDIKDGK